MNKGGPTRKKEKMMAWEKETRENMTFVYIFRDKKKERDKERQSELCRVLSVSRRGGWGVLFSASSTTPSGLCSLRPIFSLLLSSLLSNHCSHTTPFHCIISSLFNFTFKRVYQIFKYIPNYG